MKACRLPGTLVIILTLVAFVQIAIAQPESDLERLYRRIKNIEATFPFPATARTVTVGTFDAAARRFDIATGVRRISSTELLPDFGHPVHESFLIAPVDAVNVSLRFTVSNAVGPVDLTFNGQTVSAAAGQNSLTVDVGRERDIVWTIRSGNVSHQDEVFLPRPPILAAGAFRVPEIPVLLVYEPHQDSAHLNSASFTSSTSLGTSQTTSFGGVQKISSQFLSAPQMSEKLSQAISATSSIGGGFAGITGVMQGIVNALPSGAFTTTGMSTDSNDRTLTITVTDTQMFTTEAHLGPGRGDGVVLLK